MKIESRDGEATIWVYDPIGEMFGSDAVTAKGVRERLSSLRGVNKLTVRINSPGGEVDESMAIYNLLREFNGTVVTKVDGIAASAAATLFAAGEYRQVAQGAKVMIHNPWGVAVGDYRELQKASDVAKQYRHDLAAVYSDRFAMKPEAILAAMDDTTFYTADEAMVAGLATATSEPSEIAPSEIEAMAMVAMDIPKIATFLTIGEYAASAKGIVLSKPGLDTAKRIAAASRERQLALAKTVLTTARK